MTRQALAELALQLRQGLIGLVGRRSSLLQGLLGFAQLLAKRLDSVGHLPVRGTLYCRPIDGTLLAGRKGTLGLL